MISNKDRSGWFGASDTHYITGNWNTKTFVEWWLKKLGVFNNRFENKYTLAGTYYEHKILDFLGIEQKDRQIKIRKYRLRANLDGETKDTIYEVKTHKNDFRVSKAYYQQVQVQMYATGKRKAFIVAYRLSEDDYINFFNPIDKSRLQLIPIEYDEEFIKSYLTQLKYLCKCLKRRLTPNA
jgi:hypothetical protein